MNNHSTMYANFQLLGEHIFCYQILVIVAYSFFPPITSIRPHEPDRTKSARISNWVQLFESRIGPNSSMATRGPVLSWPTIGPRLAEHALLKSSLPFGTDWLSTNVLDIITNGFKLGVFKVRLLPGRQAVRPRRFAFVSRASPRSSTEPGHPTHNTAPMHRPNLDTQPTRVRRWIDGVAFCPKQETKITRGTSKKNRENKTVGSTTSTADWMGQLAPCGQHHHTGWDSWPRVTNTTTLDGTAGPVWPTPPHWMGQLAPYGHHSWPHMATTLP